MHAYLLFGWWEVLVLLNRETGSLCLCYKHQPRNWKQFSSQLKPANKNLCCQTLILVHSFNWLLFKSFHTDFDTKSLHSSMAFMILSLTSLEPMTDSCTDNTIIAPLQAGHIDSNCISSLFSPFYSAPLILRLQLGPSEPFFFVFWLLVAGIQQHWETHQSYYDKPCDLAVPTTHNFLLQRPHSISVSAFHQNLYFPSYLPNWMDIKINSIWKTSQYFY